MIAQRFRSLAWVAGVALAATLLYIISLQVATERGRLDSINRQISQTNRDIRQLQTEMGTRASLRQLERWNGDVLALSSPEASQYLEGEQSISKIDRSLLGDANAAPPPVMAAVMMPDAEPVIAATSSQKPRAEPARLTEQDRTVQRALASQKPVTLAQAEPQRRLIGALSLTSIVAQSKAEAKSGGTAKP